MQGLGAMHFYTENLIMEVQYLKQDLKRNDTQIKALTDYCKKQ